MCETFEKTFVEQCAPTLAGIKPANLFRFCYNDQLELLNMISYWNNQLKKEEINVRLLKNCFETNSYLIFVYRKNWISKIISKQEVKDFLKKHDYFISDDCDSVLEQVFYRLNINKEFPHEIGIFLGYPLCDVVGFIQNKGDNYALSGCWKVYEDPISAKSYFNLLKECKMIYKNMYESGIPIIQLAMPASKIEMNVYLS